MDVVSKDSACISATVPQSKEDRIFVTDSSSNNNYKNENVDMIGDDIQTQDKDEASVKRSLVGFLLGVIASALQATATACSQVNFVIPSAVRLIIFGVNYVFPKRAYYSPKCT